MKKYLSQIICAVLIVVSLFVGVLQQHTDVAVGKGNGANEQIKTTAEFTELLKFISASTNSGADENVNKASIRSAGVAEKGGVSLYKTVEKSSSKEYTSVTIFDTATVSASSKYSQSVNGDSYSTTRDMSMERKLSLYITENASYYSSQGTLMSKYSYYKGSGGDENKETISYVNFDIEMYFSEDQVYLKLNQFEVMSSDEEMEEGFPSEAINVWMYVDEDFSADELLGMNSTNYETLSRIGTYMEENKKSNFVEKGGVYSIKKAHAVECLSFILDTALPDDVDFEFEMDLSKQVSPEVLIKAKYDIEQYESGENHYTNQYYSFSNIGSSYSREVIRFANINNTVCNISDDIDAVSMKDLLEEE